VTFVPRGIVPDETAPTTESIEQRLTRILDDYTGVVRRAIARISPHYLHLHRDEIEQEARIRLWQALRSERNIADPASYLYRIAATATIDAVRRVKARRESPLTVVEDPDERPQQLPSVEPADSPERVAVGKEIGDHIRRALAMLPDRRRRAVGLYLQGFTTEEISGLLAWSEPKARNLVYRGLKELRQQLGRQGVDSDSAL
jgi:RNA polymerase sigma factor (sigma-70 family)